jgi:hypothetical protein
MSPGARRIKDVQLERYLAGDLEAEARGRLEAVLAESEADRARLAELRADSAAFLVKHPPGPLVARYEQESRRGWRRWPALVAPLVAALAAVVLVVVWPGEPPYSVKGGVALKVHRKQGEGSAPVEPGGAVAPGDVVSFEVKVGEGGYVAVLGRDAAGAVTVYYPHGGTEAVPYAVESPLLPAAIELDEVKGEEVVYALYSPRPFALGWAVEALRAGRALQEVAPRELAVGRTSWVKR